MTSLKDNIQYTQPDVVNGVVGKNMNKHGPWVAKCLIQRVLFGRKGKIASSLGSSVTLCV